MADNKGLMGVGVFLLLGFLLLGYGQMGQVEIDRALWLSMLATFIFVGGQGVKYGLKYKSPKVVCNPVGSSFAGSDDIQKIGDFAFIRLGGIKAGFYYKQGKSGTLIVPVEALNPLGQNLAAKCRVQQISVKDLPPIIYDVKEELGLYEPVYVGFGTEMQYQLDEDEIKKKFKDQDVDPEELDLDEPDLARTVQKLKTQNRIINDHKEMLQTATKSKEQFEDWKDRMTDKSSLWDKMRRGGGNERE